MTGLIKSERLVLRPFHPHHLTDLPKMVRADRVRLFEPEAAGLVQSEAEL
ncbi:MAG: hypothetical protein IT327_08080 [Anaerolineae bacterium]|nr:hypothetical protein [Anaerolineae bacterium]